MGKRKWIMTSDDTGICLGSNGGTRECTVTRKGNGEILSGSCLLCDPYRVSIPFLNYFILYCSIRQTIQCLYAAFFHFCASVLLSQYVVSM